jgi:hypothetical protein
MKRQTAVALAATVSVVLVALWLRHRADAGRPIRPPAGTTPVGPRARVQQSSGAAFSAALPGAARAASTTVAFEPRPGGALLRGMVFDVGGGVVAGASVVARAPAQAAEPIDITASDSTGHFQLTVPPGEAELEASADGYASVRLQVSAPQLEVSIGLVAGSVIVGRIIREDTLQPVPAVTVTASNLDGLRSLPVSARSGADGEFRIAGLPFGTYTIEAVAPRWRSEPMSIGVDVAAPSGHVDLKVRPATPFEGRVRVDGKPCASGRIDLDGPSAAGQALPVQGSVRLPGLWPGRYRVTIACVGAELNPWREDLVIGEAVVSRDWDLLPAESSDGENGDERGKPTARIQVELIAREADSTAVTVLALGTLATPLRGTRAGNRVAFERLPLGRYHVYLEQAPNVGQLVELTVDGQVGQVRLEVPAVAEISGRVVDQHDVPVPDTWVRATTSPSAVADAPLLPALTGSDGEFVIRGRLAGLYALRVEGARGQAELAAVGAGASDLVLRLGSGIVSLRASGDDARRAVTERGEDRPREPDQAR